MPKIVEVVQNVLGGGAHYYWAKIDDEGAVIGQIHGLAADADGVPSATRITSTLIATDRHWMDLNTASGKKQFSKTIA